MVRIARRAFTLSGLAVAASTGWGPRVVATPASPPLDADGQLPDGLKLETYRLWPGRAPLAQSDDPAETPTLTLFRPFPGTSNGTAVVIAPGGAYLNLALTLEGSQPAAWFAARGVTAFVLTYRVGSKAMLPAPLLDGARAIRFIRAHASDFKIDPGRIGMLGFSAGGHLAAMTAVEAGDGDAASSDLVERASSRPDFLVLAYPWLEATLPDASGQSPYCSFARLRRDGDCRSSDFASFAPAAQVTESAPPTFIYHTSADELAPVQSILRFYSALVAHKVPVELHVFESGKHGSGLGGLSSTLSLWPELLQAWLRQWKLIAPT